jgi:glycosyltransferase involved in cell wall biosynthesis
MKPYKSKFPGGFEVLMAVYNKDKVNLFKKAVDSIFTNTLLPNKVLIVIDGPIGPELSKTVLFLKSKYSLIKWIKLKCNVGLAKALNIGLNYVTTKWVVRADSDDINLPYRFEVLAKTLEKNSNLDILGSYILEVDTSGKEIGVRKVPLSNRQIYNAIKYKSPFNHMSVAFRKSKVLECGGYPNVHLKEDYALWCKMLSFKANAMNLKDILVIATGGIDLCKRRSGLNYLKSEWEIQKILVSCRLQKKYLSLFVGLVRCLVFISPNSLRFFVYSRFLREKIKLLG